MGRVGVLAFTVTYVDHQEVVRNGGRQQPGKGGLVGSQKAPIDSNGQSGLGTLPMHEFCAVGL